MKKTRILAISGMFFLGGILFTACNSEASKETPKEEVRNEQTAKTEYACPMLCEGDKTYDEEGTCPVCEMKLKPLEEVKKEQI